MSPLPHSAFGWLLSLVRQGVAFGLLSFATTVLMLVVLPILPWRRARIRAGNVFGKVIGPLVLRIVGIRLSVEHRERIALGRPAIYVPNHSSMADPWVSMWLCPLDGCGVAKREIVFIPFFGLAYFLVGHLLIHRENRARAVDAMARLGVLVRRLRLSVWVWPEGAMSRDGRLLPFKRGFVHLAIATGLPVVPVVFHDAHLRWPAATASVFPGLLRIEVLDAIDTTGWTAARATEHAADVRALFGRHLAEHQRPLPAP